MRYEFMAAFRVVKNRQVITSLIPIELQQVVVHGDTELAALEELRKYVDLAISEAKTRGIAEVEQAGRR